MWAALIKRYWQVSILRETPDNTPYSKLLMGIITLFFFFLIILQWMIADVEQVFTSSSVSILAGASLLASYAVYTFLLLLAFRVSNRFVQTFTSLLASHAIVHLFAFPLLLVTPWLLEANAIQPLALMVGIVYLILTLVLTIWQFMVTVHIYKHALMIEYMPAVLASIGLIACNILVVSLWR